MKIGRNDPCPCGSGVKYKRCHGKSRDTKNDDLNSFHTSLARALQQVKRRQEASKAFEAAHGKGREIISLEHNDWRFVAVGDAIHYSPASKTRYFSDFLSNYVRGVLGVEWGQAELKKPLDQRHQILKWYDSMCRYQQAHSKVVDDGTYRTDQPSGAMVSWYRLAYDLYQIKHNAELQARILERLRHPDQFQGARFELCVSASMVAAGFSIDFEDDSDGSRRHAEFVAKHSSGIEISVEAKSRHRDGVLGFQSPRVTQTDKVAVEGIVRSALAKNPERPFYIFVDVNMPPSEMKLEKGNPWLDEVRASVKSLENEYEPGTFPANAIFFCNDPTHYSPDRSLLEPGFWVYQQPAESPRFPLDPKLGVDVARATVQRGNVPNKFPDT